jgi:hypothetical protein
MYTVTLTLEEQQTLVDILECSIKDLRSQIVHTDRHNYKQMLKNRKQMVQNILASLQQTQIVG